MREFNVAIVGSRRRNEREDREIVFSLIEKIVENNPTTSIKIISGGCPTGADNFAAEAARHFKLDLIEHLIPSHKYLTKFAFREAAFSRNRKIADDCDVCFALVSDDRTGGTENTIGHALALKKQVFIVSRLGGLYLPSGVMIDLDYGTRRNEQD